MHGKKVRHVPTAIYGVSDDFLNSLKIDFIEFDSDNASYREPPIRLGIHVKYYIGCTFKTLVDI